MKIKLSTGIVAILSIAMLLFGQVAIAESGKPTIMKPCKQCHEAEPDYLRGRLKAKSNKAKIIQVNMGSMAWQLTFDSNTELVGAEKISKIKTNKEIGVEFEKRGDAYYAKSIEVKQAAEIPKEWVITTPEVKKLVEKGPVKGNFALYDARPMKVYLEGHIEGAISNYDAQFEKNVKLLPKNKDKLLVFYCGGPT